MPRRRRPADERSAARRTEYRVHPGSRSPRRQSPCGRWPRPGTQAPESSQPPPGRQGIIWTAVAFHASTGSGAPSSASWVSLTLLFTPPPQPRRASRTLATPKMFHVQCLRCCSGETGRRRCDTSTPATTTGLLRVGESCPARRRQMRTACRPKGDRRSGLGSGRGLLARDLLLREHTAVFMRATGPSPSVNHRFGLPSGGCRGGLPPLEESGVLRERPELVLHPLEPLGGCRGSSRCLGRGHDRGHLRPTRARGRPGGPAATARRARPARGDVPPHP